MIELRGEHVVLRALEREHCHTLWEMTEPPRMSRRSTFSQDLLKKTPTNGLKKFRVSKVRLELISERFYLGRKVIGHVQLHSIDWQDRSAELGLGFARVSDRGKGYGTNALQLIVSYAFDHLGLHRLAANPVAFNSSAIRVLEKCGFQLEGHQRDAFFFGGRWYDRVVFSILEAEFRQLSDVQTSDLERKEDL